VSSFRFGLECPDSVVAPVEFLLAAGQLHCRDDSRVEQFAHGVLSHPGLPADREQL
jgi:hypothetical protein